jgi:hypothetical protein
MYHISPNGILIKNVDPEIMRAERSMAYFKILSKYLLEGI